MSFLSDLADMLRPKAPIKSGTNEPKPSTPSGSNPPVSPTSNESTVKPSTNEPKPISSPKKINEAGIDLIKSFEGLRLQAYKCPAGIWTIGYGHTGQDVTSGLVITGTQAEELLKRDLERFEKGVIALVVVDLTSNQFSALVSFSFNVGLNNLKTSTLRRKLNTGDYVGAANELPRWNRASGKILNGLVRRREAEKALFLRTYD